MDAKADHNAQQAPEVMHANYPEPLSYEQVQQQQQYQYNNYPQHPPVPPPKAEGTINSYGSLTAPSSAYPVSQTSPSAHYAQPTVPSTSEDYDGQKRRHQPGTILGCTLTVFILSAIIAFLVMAVIALAAGTGVEASRANSAEAQVNQLYASLDAVTGTATPTSSASTATSASVSATSTSTSFASIDGNCSTNPGGVTGTTYSAFSCECLAILLSTFLCGKVD